MGRVIAYSEFESYLRGLEKLHLTRGTILDTNILISLTYEVKSDHDEIVAFVDKLIGQDFRLFTTVNTKSEFLDFHRRLIMTEHLIDMVGPDSSWKISKAALAQIQSQLGQLRRSEKQGGDPVFSDRQLKKIKSAFSAGAHSGQQGWIKLCEILLKNRLDESEAALTDFGIGYISQHEPLQEELFSEKIDWPNAKRISEQTCVGLADSMILNAFSCSRFPFLISADFDIGYAALASRDLRDIVMPDKVAKKYREFHFDDIE